LALDATAPTISVDSLITKDDTPTLTGSVSGATAVTVKVNGQDLNAVIASGKWSVDVSTPLNDGVYSVDATATDGTDTVTDSTQNELTIDTVNPGVTAVKLTTSDNTPTLTGTASDASPSSGFGSVIVVVGDNETTLTTSVLSDNSWSVTVPSALGDGTYDLYVTIKDLAGNEHTESLSNWLVVDTTGPTVTVNTQIAKTDTPTLTGTVSDSGSGIDVVTVVVGGQTLTATVNGSNWSVTVPTALDEGIYEVQATATDKAGQSASDSTSNELTIDTVAPGVTAITRNDATPTRASQVHFTVTFSEAVTGVDTGDFDIPGNGTASVSSCLDSGDHKNYTITVNTGDEGDLQLNLDDDDTIKDAAGNPLGGVGTGATGNGDYLGGDAKYVVDRTAPTSTITAPATGGTYSASNWTDVISGTATDSVGVGKVQVSVKLDSTGKYWGGTAFDQSNEYYVDATGASSWSLAFADSNLTAGQSYTVHSKATDQAGNLQGTATTSAFTFDAVGPVVSSIAKASADPTNASTVNFTVVFSKAVTGVDTSDFQIAPNSLTGSPSISSVTGSGTTYTVTATTGGGSGSLQLNLVDNDSIKDAANIALGGTGTGNGDFVGPSYTIDRNVPVASSITKADTDPTTAATVHFTVVFSEAVTGVDASDFTILVSSSLSGMSITGVTGSGTTYSVAVATGTGSGTIQLRLDDDDSIKDLAGNTLNGTSSGVLTGPTYTIQDYPSVASIVRASTNPTTASSVAFTVTFNDSVTGVDAADFALAVSGSANGSISNITGSGTSYTVTVNTVTGSGTLGLNLIDNDTIKDSSNNALGGSGTGNGSFSGETYTVNTGTTDTTPPTVSSIAKADTDPTTATSVRFTVTFSESVTGVDTSDFALAASGTAGTISSVSGSGTTYTVTVSGITGTGTLGLNLVDDDTIKDASSNALGGSGTGNGNFTGSTYTIQSGTSTASLSGMVYVDANNDGAYAITSSTHHAGIGGVTIRLQRTDISGQPEMVRVTKPDGSFSFTGLPAGTYTLVEDQPSKFIDGTDTLGTGPGTVGTAGNDKFTGIVLAVGQSGVNYYFGERGVSANYYSIAMALASSPTGTQAANQYTDNLVVGPADTIGLYDPDTSVFYLRNTNTMGMADSVVAFGQAGAGWLPIAGDWDGDGIDTIGLYNPATSTFYLRSSNTTGMATTTFAFGTAGGGLKPIVGDWDGDGDETVGLFNPATATFYLRNSLTTGMADVTFAYGTPGANLLPVAGDWNGNGVDTVGVYDSTSGLFALTNVNQTGVASISFTLPGAAAGSTPRAGDFDGDGTATAAAYTSSSSYFYLGKGNTAPVSALSVGFGNAGDNWLPVVGRWIDQAGYQSLLAAEGAVAAGPSVEAVRAEQLPAIVETAIQRWEAAGLAENLVEAMRQVRVSVADLPGAQLGAAGSQEILLDVNAAGHGWFVDATPAADEEFQAAGGGLQAVSPQAVDHIDLESVVMHELGHIVGLDDLAASSSLMGESLQSGQRKMPGADEVAAVFAAAERP
jgi:hypothetical protein